MESLEERWLALWQRIRAKGDGREVYADLVCRYSESHRAYHTLSHIEHCLFQLEISRKLAMNPDAVEFALWFHDAVYNIKTNDNEKRSVAFMIKVGKKAGLAESFIRLVADLILATTHDVAPSGLDAQLLVDIDLSILGQPKNVFDEYELQIREEYGLVPDGVFKIGRRKILDAFIDVKRRRIYSTEFFYDKYEARAVANIARSITNLLLSV